MNRNFWTKIGSLPALPRYWVEVCGDSGMQAPRWFVCVAKYDEDRGGWVDESGDRITERWPSGPLYYRNLSFFPLRDPEDFKR